MPGFPAFEVFHRTGRKHQWLRAAAFNEIDHPANGPRFFGAVQKVDAVLITTKIVPVPRDQVTVLINEVCVIIRGITLGFRVLDRKAHAVTLSVARFVLSTELYVSPATMPLITVSRSGLSVTTVIGFQFRVWRAQRRGARALACW